MSTFSQFIGGARKVSAITNRFSAGGAISSNVVLTETGHKALAAASLVANTLQTALSISGRGTLNVAHAQTSNATTKSIRLKVTIDGRVIFDATSSAASVAPAITGVGHLFYMGTATKYNVDPQPIPFETSCLVEVASSETEATGINTLVSYEVNV